MSTASPAFASSIRPTSVGVEYVGEKKGSKDTPLPLTNTGLWFATYFLRS